MIALFAGVAIGGRYLSGPEAALSSVSHLRSTEARGPFTLCAEHFQAECGVDGDTIRYQGRRIRVADIDAPEIHDPRCASELALGQRATARLFALVNDGPFEIASSGSRDTDRYGRDLRILVRNGRSLGAMLVDEGLARRWDGARHPWCA
jgi:endonuclease YncB( thermonuclease family)